MRRFGKCWRSILPRPAGRCRYMQDFFNRVWNLKVAASALMVVVLAGTGCRLGQPESSSFASVVIAGKTPQQICQTTAMVFQADGYQVARLHPEDMVFQKEASRGASMAYGGLADTYYGSLTLVRVRAQVVDLGAGSCRLQCKAFMVRDASDSFFEDESALLNIRSGPYQSLLNRVAKSLK